VVDPAPRNRDQVHRCRRSSDASDSGIQASAASTAAVRRVGTAPATTGLASGWACRWRHRQCSGGTSGTWSRRCSTAMAQVPMTSTRRPCTRAAPHPQHRRGGARPTRGRAPRLVPGARRVRNCSSATVPFVIDALRRAGRLRPGRFAVVLVFGPRPHALRGAAARHLITTPVRVHSMVVRQVVEMRAREAPRVDARRPGNRASHAVGASEVDPPADDSALT
jgi:hypothetical protein